MSPLTDIATFRRDVLSEVGSIDIAGMRRIGIRRDPGRYTLLAHFLPTEVTLESLADDRLRARLSEPTGPVSLYAHVPPCTGRCTYCHYAIEVEPEPDRMEDYLATLEREIAVRWRDDRTGPVASLLIGGGTPTYLDEGQLERLLTRIRTSVTIPETSEFTVESAPETLTVGKLELLRRFGVNRLNIGIQSFDDRLLRLLARRHTAAEAEASIAMARAVGLTNINIDLIYAMPEQGFDTWVESLDRAIALRPQSITTYHLRKKRVTHISKHASPPEDDNLAMHLAGIRRLEAGGYRQSPTDYFCLDDKETGQVQARDKWRDMQPVDGVGLDATSRRPDLIAYNHGAWDAYVESAEAQQGWSLGHGRFLTREEQMSQRAMFALKSLDPGEGIDKAAFEAEYGESIDALYGKHIKELQGVGLIVDEGPRVRMTSIGTLFADEVCEYFYPVDLRRRIQARKGVYVGQTAMAAPAGQVQRLEFQTTDVLVIGGGLAGLAAAAEVQARLGASVALLEARPTIGLGARAEGLGGPFAGAVTGAARAVLAEMAVESRSLDAGWLHEGDPKGGVPDPTDCVWLARTDDDVRRLHEDAGIAGAAGLKTRWIPPSQLAALLPGLNPSGLRGALLGHGAAGHEGAALVSAFERAIDRGGGRLHTSTWVRSLIVDHGRVVGVRTDKGVVFAGHLVLATGGGSDRLLGEVGVHLPLRALTASVVEACELTGGARWPLVLATDPAVALRGTAGGLCLGATTPAVALDPPLDAWAASLVPGLDDARFEQAWQGTLAGTPDGLPWVGPCPGLDGLVLALGFEAGAASHASCAGRLVAQWLGGRAAGTIAQALDPRR